MKRRAAETAVDEVRDGMRLGLGTGSTAEEFLRALADRLAVGEISEIRATCTSTRTEALAREFGIEVFTLEDLGEIDLAVDGADEIDRHLRLIKGRGGALLREKIVEQSAKRFLVIADETKLVERLGRGRLPVEVVRFATAHLLDRFRRLELDPVLRLHADEPFLTDEQHHIIDVTVPPGTEIASLADRLRRIAGVVETGLFATEATDAIIGTPGGTTRMSRDG
ncbi:MAG: ribose-5-phosphate isomerase RpiA [Thermoanaerobaculia bacterium]